jgi:CBS domain-containing protein
MLTKDFMTTNVMTCTPENTVGDAAKMMVQNGFSVIPVIDEKNEVLGIVTESDFVGKEIEIPHALASIKQLFGQNFFFKDVEKVYENSKGLKLAKVMSSMPVSISPETPLSEVIQLMLSKNKKKLPVTEGRTLAGIVTRKDLIKAFQMLNN